jgi:hypothetical protein
LTVLDASGIPVAFAENFETDTSARWIERAGFAGAGPDYTSDYAFDYSSYFSAFFGGPIPSAPASETQTTLGLKLTVNNNDGIGALASICLYPEWQTFQGAHRLKFDMWINYPGGVGGAGGSGTTENAYFGLNCSGNYANWDNASSAPSDGVWFTVNGDGDAVNDYRAHVGGTNNATVTLPFSESGLPISGAPDANASSEPYPTFLPSPPVETPGVPGKAWVQVEVEQDAGNVLSWRMNDNLFAQRTNATAFTSGNIMIGYADLFTSLANPAADSFMLYDNVRVELEAADLGPVITQQPTNQTRRFGEFGLFSVETAGPGPMHYQWRQNGTNLPAATNQSLALPTVTFQDAGDYSVRISNAVLSVTSTIATLTITPDTNAPTVITRISGDTLKIEWPPSHTGWRLEVQTNSISTGLAGNWVTVPGSETTNQFDVLLEAAGLAFFRLAYP